MPLLAAVATLVCNAPALGAAAGDLDPSFGGGDGMLTMNLGELRRDGPATSIVRQSDGKYVIGSVYDGLSNDAGDIMLVRYMPDGSLDPSFGGDGIVITDIGFAERVTDVELQADGKIVVAVDNILTHLVFRYEPDGDLDPTFDGDGWLSTSFIPGYTATRALAIDSVGRIVVVGTRTPAPGSPPGDMTVSRYTPAGTLDATFDGDGQRTVDLGGDDRIWSVAIASGDKVVAAGTSASLFALARLNADGSLDTNADADPGTHFGTDGIVTTDVGPGTDVANDVAIQPDGKVLAAGNSGVNFGLARYNPADGSLDTSFDPIGLDGTVTTGFGPNTEGRAESVALDAGAKIVVAGTMRTSPPDPPTFDFAVARYNPNGGLDSTFGGGDGLVTNPVGDKLLGVRAEPGGKVIAAGHTDGYSAVARYEADGDLDPTFSGNGIADDPLLIEPSGDGVAKGFVYPDGKILTLNTTYLGERGTFDGERGGANAQITRHNPDGSLDSGFGSGGLATVSFSTPASVGFHELMVRDDGKIVIAGTDHKAFFPLTTDGLFARLNADGSLDTTFSGDGKLRIVNHVPNAGAVLADGSLVITTTQNGGNPLIRKFTPAGDPHPFFGGGDGIAPFPPFDGPRALLALADGRFVVAFREVGDESALARYEADGDLDLTFGGGDGVVKSGFQPTFVEELIAQPDGKLIMVGDTPGVTPDFSVVRFTPDGVLDTGFGGGDGLVTEDFGQSEIARDIVLQPDGKLVVAGNSMNGPFDDTGGNFALARYTPAGEPDPSFGGGDGKLLTNFLPTASDFGSVVGVQPGGNIVVAGWTLSNNNLRGDLAFARYLGVGDPPPGPGPDPGPGPGPEPGPDPLPDPPPLDPTIGVPSVCVEIRPGIRKRTKLVPGGGEVLLTVAQSDDPAIPLKITAGARRGVKIKSVAFKVNKKAVTGTGSTRACRWARRR